MKFYITLVVTKEHESSIVQQLFWAGESCMSHCFNLVFSRRFFKRFKPKSQQKNDPYVGCLVRLSNSSTAFTLSSVHARLVSRCHAFTDGIISKTNISQGSVATSLWNAVGSVMTGLLRIFCGVGQRRNFENRKMLWKG